VARLYRGFCVPVTTRALRAAICRHLLSCPACRDLARDVSAQASPDMPIEAPLWEPEDLVDLEFVTTVLGYRRPSQESPP
jgi:hypothetical protein